MGPLRPLTAALAGVTVSAAALAAQRVDGVVRDRDSGEAVATATVAMLDSLDTVVASTVTAGDGRFVLVAPTAGRYRFRVERLGYATQTLAAGIRLDAGETATITLRVSVEAVPLAAVVVRGRSARRQAELARGTPARVLTRADLEEAIRTTAPRNVGDVVRRFPDVMVRTVIGVGGRYEVCVESLQRIRHTGGCDMVLVVFNGTPVADAGSFLTGLAAEDLESIEFLKPSEAGVYWGTRGGNGVLLLNSRGGGPWAEGREGREVEAEAARQARVGRLGYLLGAGAAGGAGGIALGGILACGLADCPFGSVSTGAAAIEATTLALTIPIAVHYANGRRGPLWAEIVASTLIGAAGVALWEASEQPAYLVAVPVLQLGVSVILERR